MKRRRQVALKTIKDIGETGKFRELTATAPYMLRQQWIETREVSGPRPIPSSCVLLCGMPPTLSAGDQSCALDLQPAEESMNTADGLAGPSQYGAIPRGQTSSGGTDDEDAGRQQFVACAFSISA